jgi:FAD/FMN-containing dehydrogenase
VPPLAGEWPWHILVDISSGRSQEDARSLIEMILTEGIERGIVGDAAIAESIGQANAFWALRETISEAQKPAGASIKHDISVPVASTPEFIARARGRGGGRQPRRARRLLRPHGRR